MPPVRVIIAGGLPARNKHAQIDCLSKYRLTPADASDTIASGTAAEARSKAWITEEAQVFTDYFAAEAAPIWQELALARWNLATTGESRYKEEIVALRKREHQLYEDPGTGKQVQAFYAARGTFDNPLLVRQIEVATSHVPEQPEYA
jgi:hypothetical protein